MPLNNKDSNTKVCLSCTLLILNFRTDRSRKIVQTQIRPFGGFQQGTTPNNTLLHTLASGLKFQV